jgi:thiol-disulfide isomerase/thioredoxin
VHDVPPDGITRLHSPEEYEAMVAATGSGSLPAIVMNKSKSCKPCRAFNKTYYQYAEKFKGRCDFYEIYGDESKETIKLMMKVRELFVQFVQIVVHICPGYVFIRTN